MLLHEYFGWFQTLHEIDQIRFDEHSHVSMNPDSEISDQGEPLKPGACNFCSIIWLEMFYIAAEL